jgi:hypothetical protein
MKRPNSNTIKNGTADPISELFQFLLCTFGINCRTNEDIDR